MQEGVEAMKKRVSIAYASKADLVSISVSLQDRELAAAVANTYLEELGGFLNQNALSTAKRNRVFVENQLRLAQSELAEYETAVKNFQEKHKVISLDAQAEASVKAYSDIKARLTAAEIELRVLEQGSIQGSTEVTLKRYEVTELRQQLAKLENDSNSSPIVSFKEAPNLGLTYARLKRDLLVRGKVFELLTQQFEMAKIKEAQEDISFQVLDHAVPPDKKSGPKRLLIIVAAMVGSMVLGSVLALLSEFWRTNTSRTTA
jgi:uncharacterized protein involved in exopolysaccharide biosynthesis